MFYVYHDFDKKKILIFVVFLQSLVLQKFASTKGINEVLKKNLR